MPKCGPSWHAGKPYTGVTVSEIGSCYRRSIYWAKLDFFDRQPKGQHSKLFAEFNTSFLRHYSTLVICALFRKGYIQQSAIFLGVHEHFQGHLTQPINLLFPPRMWIDVLKESRPHLNVDDIMEPERRPLKWGFAPNRGPPVHSLKKIPFFTRGPPEDA